MTKRLTCGTSPMRIICQPISSVFGSLNLFISTLEAGGLGGLNDIYVHSEHKRRKGILNRGDDCMSNIEIKLRKTERAAFGTYHFCCLATPALCFEFLSELL